MRFSTIAAFALPLFGLAAASSPSHLHEREAMAESQPGMQYASIAADDMVLSRRDLHSIVSQAKRESYIAAYDAIADLHRRGEPIVRLGRRADADLEAQLQTIYDNYKADGKAWASRLKEYKAEKDYAKKVTIATQAISEIDKEIAGRKAAIPLFKRLGRTAAVITTHEHQITEKEACKKSWETRKSSAQKKVPDAATGC